LVGALVLANHKRHAVILRDAALARDAHILLAGIARITCRNARNERVTVAMLAPGPKPEFPALPLSQSGFQCEAYNDCRVGTVSWADFDGTTANAPDSAFKQFHGNDLKQWYRLLLRSSSFLNLSLYERIAIAMLELCADFGTEESRGTLLRVSFSHKDIANLVGASRPRVTEHWVVGEYCSIRAALFGHVLKPVDVHVVDAQTNRILATGQIGSLEEVIEWHGLLSKVLVSLALFAMVTVLAAFYLRLIRLRTPAMPPMRLSC
jgi:hypothetical protein